MAVAAAGGFIAVKWFADMLQTFSLEARPFVADLQDPVCFCHRAHQLDGFTRRTVADRVIEQIDQRPSQCFGMHPG